MINSPIKLMLVEDHKLMRVGLKSLFEPKDGMEVTSEAQRLWISVCLILTA